MSLACYRWSSIACRLHGTTWSVSSWIDEDLTAEGFSPVRYADDLVVVTATKDDAQEALRVTAASVKRLSMELGAEDTQVMSFQDGFTFLGEDFGPRYPPLLDDVRLEEPERKVLYAGPQGGRVRIHAGRIIVESADDVELVDVPSSHLRRMVLFGAVGLSAGARSWAMANGVDVVFASRRGSYLGALSGSAGSRADRVRRQLAIADTPQSLDIGRVVVDGKIRKQIILLRRFGWRESADLCRDAVSSMEQALRLLPDAQAPAELMGVEGAAAAAYFPAFGSLFPEGLRSATAPGSPHWTWPSSALSLLLPGPARGSA